MLVYDNEGFTYSVKRDKHLGEVNEPKSFVGAEEVDNLSLALEEVVVEQPRSCIEDADVDIPKYRVRKVDEKVDGRDCMERDEFCKCLCEYWICSALAHQCFPFFVAAYILYSLLRVIYCFLREVLGLLLGLEEDEPKSYTCVKKYSLVWRVLIFLFMPIWTPLMFIWILLWWLYAHTYRVCGGSGEYPRNVGLEWTIERDTTFKCNGWLTGTYKFLTPIPAFVTGLVVFVLLLPFGIIYGIAYGINYVRGG